MCEKVWGGLRQQYVQALIAPSAEVNFVRGQIMGLMSAQQSVELTVAAPTSATEYSPHEEASFEAKLLRGIHK